MKGALFFGFLVIVAQCWAGHYDVSFSGGTCHTTGDYGDHSWPYAAVAGGWGGTAPTGGSTQGGPIGPGTGDCTGQITATFTWNNGGDLNSLPPEAVIIKQTSSASWAGDSGACNDGLGDPAVPSAGGQTSSGVHWIARSNPGNSFQITVTPSATVSAGGGFQFGPPEGGSCSVTFGVETYSVRMAIHGVIPIGTDQALLIGQKFSAEISLDPGSPTSANDTYAWTVSGGDPFADYSMPPPSGPGVYTPFSSPNSATMACYFAHPQSGITVTCSVGLPLAGINLNLSKNNIASVAPDYALQVIQGTPQMVLDGTIPGLWWIRLFGAEFESQGKAGI
jgi:hypothetical protein